MTFAFPRFTAAARCADEASPDAFFPERGDTAAAAKRICNGDDDRPPCPAREECLAWAMAHPEAGVWGGRSRLERYWLRRRRAA